MSETQTDQVVSASTKYVELPDDLRETFNKTVESMIRNELSRSDILMPQAFLTNSKGELTICAVPLSGDPNDRSKAFNMVRIIALKHGAVSSFFYTEAYGKTASDSEDFEAQKNKDLSKDPEADEIVLVQVETLETTYLAKAVISGKHPGRTCGEFKFVEAKGFQGRMANLLPKLKNENVH